MRLITNASGIAVNNTDNISNAPTPNLAAVFPNPDPVFVESSLLYTLYFWADDWDTAQVTIYVSPQIIPVNTPLNNCQSIPQIAPVWFPLLNAQGNAVSVSGDNSYVNFSLRWGMIKAVITNASANTTNLNCSLFGVAGNSCS